MGTDVLWPRTDKLLERNTLEVYVMSLRRWRVELAFQEPIPSSLLAQLLAIERSIGRVQPQAVKINPGQANEEDTTSAKWHICHHDTPEIPCEPEQEMGTVAESEISDIVL